MENEPVEPPTKRNTTKIFLVSGSILVFIIIGFANILFLACLGVGYPIQILFDTFTGWFSFIKRVIPLMTLSVTGLMTALFLSTIMAVVIQRLGSYLIRHFHKQNWDSVPDHWRLRWTFASMVFLVISFAGGFAVVGIAQQGARLVTGHDFLNHQSESANRSTSRNNLKQVGLAMHNYYETHAVLPPGGTFGNTGQPQHSWVSQLLPYLDQEALYNKIDFNQPWDTVENRKSFETSIPTLQIPGMGYIYDNGKSNKENAKGYQPSHYAANNRVLNVNSGMDFKKITDGMSNTLLAGEIKINIKPWGDPTNFRDLTLGINKSPHGFGGPFTGGAHFLFGDGRARFITNQIAPAVLKALSTPAGSDSVGDF